MPVEDIHQGYTIISETNEIHFMFENVTFYYSIKD